MLAGEMATTTKEVVPLAPEMRGVKELEGLPSPLKPHPSLTCATHTH